MRDKGMNSAYVDIITHMDAAGFSVQSMKVDGVHDPKGEEPIPSVTLQVIPFAATK